MYIKFLNNVQQKIFLGFAQKVIESDKKIMHQERELLNQLSNEIQQYEMISNPSYDLLNNYFNDLYSKRVFIMELLCLAACDGEIAMEEEEIILNCCKELNIANEEYNKIKSYVINFYNLKNEIENFLFKSDTNKSK